MYEFYVTIVGAWQGPFRGESPSERHAGKLVGLAYDQGASAMPAPSGRKGRTVLQPVRFSKQWGAASPQLMQALATSEPLSAVVFEFMRMTEEGEEEVFHRVSLHGAQLVELRSFVDLDAEPSALMPLPPLEDITIAYTGITIENLAQGTSATAGVLPRAPKAAGVPKKAAKAAAKSGAKTGAKAKRTSRPRN